VFLYKIRNHPAITEGGRKLPLQRPGELDDDPAAHFGERLDHHCSETQAIVVLENILNDPLSFRPNQGPPPPPHPRRQTSPPGSLRSHEGTTEPGPPDTRGYSPPASVVRRRCKRSFRPDRPLPGVTKPPQGCSGARDPRA